MSQGEPGGQSPLPGRSGLSLYPATVARLARIRNQLRLEWGRPVSNDEIVNRALDLFEQQLPAQPPQE